MKFEFLACLGLSQNAGALYKVSNLWKEVNFEHENMGGIEG